MPALAQHFIHDFSVRHGVMGVSFSEEAMQALLAHSWPGNIRELKAVVENAAMVTRSGLIGRSHVEKALQARSAEPDSWQGRAAAPVKDAEPMPPVMPDEEPTQVSGVMPVAATVSAPPHAGGPRRSPSLPDLQRDMILRAFEESERNLSKAALDLGIPRSTLRARLKRYGVR